MIGTPIDYVYQIDFARYPRKIYRIKDVYQSETAYYADTTQPIAGGSDATTITSNNLLNDLNRSLIPHRAWTFEKPNRLRIHNTYTTVHIYESLYIEAGVSYANLAEIAPDAYESAFKKLAFADVVEAIVELRGQFQQLATPQGVVNINIDRLERKGEQARQEAMTYLDGIILDKFYWFI
jgi:hypothetical protein